MDREATRRVVAAFVGDVLRGENPGRLTEYFDGDSYIQHNAGIADGLSGLGAALEALAMDRAAHPEGVRCYASKDLYDWEDGGRPAGDTVAGGVELVAKGMMPVYEG